MRSNPEYAVRILMESPDNIVTQAVRITQVPLIQVEFLALRIEFIYAATICSDPDHAGAILIHCHDLVEADTGVVVRVVYEVDELVMFRNE